MSTMYSREQILEVPVPLQEWFNTEVLDPKDAKAIAETGVRRPPRAGGPDDSQIMFIRDRILPLLVRDVGYEDRKRGDRQCLVVSSHNSKSTKLPVYHIKGDDCEVWMRGNYYDWKVSVRSSRPVEDVLSLLSPLVSSGKDTAISDVYFEGFADEWIFGAWDDNPREFSIELSYSFEPLWAFMYMLTERLRASRPE